MSRNSGSLADLIERLKNKAPEYIDLFAAETDEEFETAFLSILQAAVQHLEKNKKNFSSLSEEGLSAALAGVIIMPGLTVTQETNSNGHVDLIIEADHCVPARIKLGEAKIYSSPSYHVKGIGQLLQRYTTGRELAGLLISYVRKNDIKAITSKLKAALDEKKPFKQQGVCSTHKLKWSLITKHIHSSGETVTIDHIGLNLSL
jgi:hypothetical protein